MQLINNFTYYIIPFFIGIIMLEGIKEKINIFDLFLDGAEEGIKIVVRLIPTLIGIFFLIELLRSSGVIECVTNVIRPIVDKTWFPSEILPLVLIRPISGSGAIGVATDIIKTYGVDSYLGIVAAVIVGATETTIYTIAVYTSGLKVNKSKKLLIAALSADIVGMVAAVVICRIMSMDFS